MNMYMCSHGCYEVPNNIPVQLINTVTGRYADNAGAGCDVSPLPDNKEFWLWLESMRDNNA